MSASCDSMADEEDEDVVFEGSAIYQHLLDTGYTDFAPSQLMTLHHKENVREDDFSENKKGTLDSLKEKWSRLHPAVLGTYMRELVGYKKIVECVTQSKLVNNDDWLVLEHFMPGGEQLHHTGSFAAPWTSWYKIVLFIGFTSFLLSVPLVLYLACETWLGYLSLSIVLTFPGIMIVEETSAFIRHLILTYNIKEFVLLMKETSTNASRSVRLLQEVDLITKGFVLAQGSIPATFSEESDFPQCFNLCSALISALNSLGQVLYQNHQYLGQCSPEYPCMRQLFNKVEAPDFKRSGCNTEYITFLKKWVAITKLQLSAVLTELLLCVHKPLMLDKLYDMRNKLFSSSQVVVVKRETKFLRNNLEYTRSFWLRDRQEEEKPTSLEEKKKNVYIAIHSLSLHMQAALFRVQDLENKFESENVSNNFTQDFEQEHRNNLPSYEYVREQLYALKTELDSCQGCLEEAEARADRKYGKNDSELMPKLEHQHNTSDEVNNALLHDAKKSVIVLNDIEESVIEDEVFEAYIDEEYKVKQREDCDNDFWTTNNRKERQILKQQKAQGKRVLNELQPILIKRRKMWEQREMAALSRQHTKKAQTLKVESSKDEEDSKGEFLNNLDDGSVMPEAQEVRMEQKVWEADILCKSRATGNYLQSSQLKDINGCEPLQKDIEEIDSDEERLQEYRKLKHELDEDEKRRIKEDEEEGSVLMPFESHEGSTEFKTSNFEDLEYENQCQLEEKQIICSPIFHKYKEISDSLSDQEYGNEELHSQEKSAELRRSDNDNFGTDTYSYLKFGLVNHDAVTCAALQEGESETLMTEFKSEPVGETKTSIYKLDEKMDEEFIHNEEIDQDNSPHIDWSIITVPNRQTETLDERMQLFSDGQNIGFHAEVAAEAQAASKKFWAASSNLSQMFKAVGEGEEVFGSDTDDDE